MENSVESVFLQGMCDPDLGCFCNSKIKAVRESTYTFFFIVQADTLQRDNIVCFPVLSLVNNSVRS